MHLNYKIQLPNDKRVITNALTWPKSGWGINSMFRDYNTIYVLRGNTDEKSVVWTDLYQYGLIVKKTYNTEISSINREILRINSYLN